MFVTRTGQFAIGLRRSFPAWHKNLDGLIQWMKANDFGVIDLGKDADSTARTVARAGLRIGSADLPNWHGLIAKDAADRRSAIRQTTDYVKAACDGAGTGLNFFVVMTPADPSLPRAENFGYMVESYSELAPVFEQHNSAVVIEGWPGPGALCCTPETIRAFYAKVPSKAMAFNFDPSHLIRMGIDPLRFLREFGGRVRHIHGKDTEILTEELYELGNTQPPAFAKGPGFGGTYWRYTIPGHGCMRWTAAFKILQGFGYQGAVSIELEDANFTPGDEDTKRGFLLGAQYLSGC